MRLMQREAEKAFRGLVNTQSIQSNVPDTLDPNVARIIFNSNNKQINITQNACQLILKFQEPEKLSLEEQWDVIKKNVKDFHNKAMVFKQSGEYGVSSLVFPIAVKSNASSAELNKLLYNKLVKQHRSGDIASVSVAIGYKHDLWYLNVNISAYEKRQFNIKSIQGQLIHINLDLDKLPVTGRGINLAFDVNNRPKFQQNETSSIDTPEETLRLAQDFSAEQLTDFFAETEA